LNKKWVWLWFWRFLATFWVIIFGYVLGDFWNPLGDLKTSGHTDCEPNVFLFLDKQQKQYGNFMDILVSS
jgi:hypothetical protein